MLTLPVVPYHATMLTVPTVPTMHPVPTVLPGEGRRRVVQLGSAIDPARPPRRVAAGLPVRDEGALLAVRSLHTDYILTTY